MTPPNEKPMHKALSIKEYERFVEVRGPQWELIATLEFADDGSNRDELIAYASQFAAAPETAARLKAVEEENVKLFNEHGIAMRLLKENTQTLTDVAGERDALKAEAVRAWESRYQQLKRAERAEKLNGEFKTLLIELKADVEKLRWGQSYPGRNHSLMDKIETAISGAAHERS